MEFIDPPYWEYHHRWFDLFGPTHRSHSHSYRTYPASGPPIQGPHPSWATFCTDFYPHHPFSWGVEMALKIKGIEYEFIEEDLKNKSPQLLEYNPIHKKVPVLLHNGKPIAESLVILEYIDETWEGPSLLPKDPYERAMVRFWVKTVDEKCTHAMWKAFWSVGEEREKKKEEATQVLKFLDNEVKGKKFFGGDTIGLVDITANFIGYWYGVIEESKGVEIITKDKFPNLCKWIDEYNNCNFVKENLPPRGKMTQYFKALFQDASAAR